MVDTVSTKKQQEHQMSDEDTNDQVSPELMFAMR